MVIFLVLQRVPTGWQGIAGDSIVAPKKRSYFLCFAETEYQNLV